ncbi:CapA family protein [Alkalicoccus urumqiensis]|uniref:Capsule synthesis protein CapA domain-containing protein n=1 Tax=Alkalicoccus urumqiensis TaxID=1548213 RepID=A0A2P6MHS1_ALKUR|nr:CapA family protein [Alkalicoccus urumqiensis]PRO65845.1 hypothetical protein C6I21_08080 [Alkalicoccus urumqiensis]
MTKIFIGGDIVNYQNESGLLFSDELEYIIKQSNYAICNFEAPISGFGNPIKKSGPHHSQLSSTLNGLKKQGMNMVCLANNHMMDYGADGMKKTKEFAESIGLSTVGSGMDIEEAYAPQIVEIGDKKIAIINACEAQFGVIDYFAENEASLGYAWINHSRIDLSILKCKQKYDHVIVVAHAGLEHYSIPQREWRVRYKSLIDLGADAVIASHPHVPQGYEKYNGGVIAYSLGNFYFDSKNYVNKKGHTYSVILDFADNEVNLTPIFHHKENQTVVLSKEEERINIDELNKMLEDPYDEKHEEMVLSAYQSVGKNFNYSISPFPVYGGVIKSLLRMLKRIIMFLLKRKRTDKTLLSLHLFRNEAYYYVIRNALEIKNRR